MKNEVKEAKLIIKDLTDESEYLRTENIRMKKELKKNTVSSNKGKKKDYRSN